MKNLYLICLTLIFSGIFLVGCPIYEAALEDQIRDTSISSSETTTTTIVITPTNTTVTTGSTTTFSASGGITPITWSISDDTLGSIDSSTGVFSANSGNTGSATITVTDSSGNNGTTTVTIS